MSYYFADGLEYAAHPALKALRMVHSEHIIQPRPQDRARIVKNRICVPSDDVEVFLVLKVLVITTCTGTKSVKHDDQLTLEDFREPDRLAARSQALLDSNPDLAVPAIQMYTGRQHQYVVNGVTRLREVLGSHGKVDLSIVSAGYGLLGENDLILPYEATFNGMRKKELQAYSRDVLHLHERVQHLIKGYDLILFLAGETYLKAIGLPLSMSSSQGMIFVAGTAARKWFPREHLTNLVSFSNDDVKILGGGQIGLKGIVLQRLASTLSETHGEPHDRISALKSLAETPATLRTLLQVPEQVRLPMPHARRRRTPLVMVRQEVARNAGKRPSFFVPDWDDLVNPDYDFLEDKHPQARFDPYDHGVYSHEIFSDSPGYDGILVSRAVVDSSNEKKRSKFRHVHDFLRWPHPRPVMGDCGAFSYIDHEVPPYTTEDVLRYYEDYGFDLGVSVDHLIVGDRSQDERERRFRITQDNAQEFLSKHQTGGYTFTPMGVAQGWDNESYRRAVDGLLQMGYRHIAFGGLAFAKSQFVVDLLAHVSPLFPEDLYVHLFGLAREELLAPYSRFGVSAFDSATFLRRAWMSGRDNYLDAQSGEWYTAVRIPPYRYTVNGKVRYHREVKSMITDDSSRARIEALEKSALHAVRAYAHHKATLAEALQAVLEYDALVLPNRDLESAYTRTLSERPWERCDCPICRSLGVEVIIFRANDRNRRRGFHNSYAFRRLEERAVAPE